MALQRSLRRLAALSACLLLALLAAPAAHGYTPNDPGAKMGPLSVGGKPPQWYLIDQNLPAAWNLSRGEGAEVAVIDSGVDSNHPDLAPALASLVDRDRTPDHGGAGIDEAGHGTHVAGLACGRGDNGTGIVGTGFGCSLYIEKTDFSAGSIAKSIRDAVAQDVDVINMSFVGPAPSPVVKRAIDYAWQNDVVMVAAAADGATTNQGYPARYLQPQGTAPKLGAGQGLVVTAAGPGGMAQGWAGRGSGVSLAAAGGGGDGVLSTILSSVPSSQTAVDSCGCRVKLDSSSYASLSGTSMAAPQVAGVAALIRSRHPDMPAAQVIRIIKESATGGYSSVQGWGMLDAGAALAASG
jgi:subtilisin family serine protease